MIRLSGYTIFNCIGVGLGRRLSNIEIDEGNALAQTVYNIQWWQSQIRQMAIQYLMDDDDA